MFDPPYPCGPWWPYPVRFGAQLFLLLFSTPFFGFFSFALIRRLFSLESVFIGDKISQTQRPPPRVSLLLFFLTASSHFGDNFILSFRIPSSMLPALPLVLIPPTILSFPLLILPNYLDIRSGPPPLPCIFSRLSTTLPQRLPRLHGQFSGVPPPKEFTTFLPPFLPTLKGLRLVSPPPPFSVCTSISVFFRIRITNSFSPWH